MKIQTFLTTVFMENCYLFEDGGEAMLVDPGELTGDLHEALKSVNLKYLVNTHCHIDHSGGNAAVKRNFNAPLLVPEKDLPLLRTISQQAMMFGVRCEASPEPDRFIAEGDTLRVGAHTFTIFDTPGHSPGHVILVGDGFTFSGDVLFQNSIGRTDLPGGDYEELMRSIQSKLLCLPDDTIVYSGHGPETTIGAERRYNPFLEGL